MASLQDLLAKIPVAQDAMAKVDALKAQFLAIPATTQQNKAVLSYARSKTNDATEVASLTQLQQKASAVEAGFQSVLAQFSSFDTLRRSGASSVQIGTAAAALVSGAQSVRSQSDALTRAVAPIAQKYGQPVPTVGGGGVSSLAILALVGVGMVFMLKRQKRK
jgi:hypothetical protein